MRLYQKMKLLKKRKVNETVLNAKHSSTLSMIKKWCCSLKDWAQHHFFVETILQLNILSAPAAIHEPLYLDHIPKVCQSHF